MKYEDIDVPICSLSAEKIYKYRCTTEKVLKQNVVLLKYTFKILYKQLYYFCKLTNSNLQHFKGTQPLKTYLFT